MDTSGILVLGLTKESHRNLSIQFQDRKVEKKYQALLRGKLSERLENITCGKIEFPMRVDLDNRPYQIYDEEYGRMATTEWKLIEEFSLEESFLQGEHEQDSLWRTRVEFMPITGRTHQLRLHSAHEKGLGLGIVGDRLYGKIFSDERLCLQAFYLKFTHPTTNEIMEFSVPFEF
jgi:tRNA pseudouridine32 synthase/23S rRNA pseudouridine746 synthase